MGQRAELRIDGSVATVRLCHPPLNAVDTLMRTELAECAGALADAPDVRAVVIHGGERVFAAGADIHALREMDYRQIVGWNRALQRTFDLFARLPMPVVAAVNGYALGGGLELALCADYRIAARDAVLGQPEVLLGIMPGSGGTQRLARLIGPSRAKNLLMTGRRVDASEALRLGLVDELVPAGEAYESAVRYARRLAEGPAFALQAIKEAVDLGLDSSLQAGLALERGLFAGLFATPDRESGMRSFVQEGPGRARFGDSGGPDPDIS